MTNILESIPTISIICLLLFGPAVLYFGAVRIIDNIRDKRMANKITKAVHIRVEVANKRK